MINKLLRQQKNINETAEIFDLIPQNRKKNPNVSVFLLFLSDMHIDIAEWSSLIYLFEYDLADRNIYRFYAVNLEKKIFSIVYKEYNNEHPASFSSLEFSLFN